MPDFAYKGRASGGSLVTGELAAESMDLVATRLMERGITPVEIRPVAHVAHDSAEAIWRRLGGGRPTTKDLTMFCRQMHTITRSGIPLLRGLSSLSRSTHHAMLREALAEVIESLHAGRGLSESLRRHPNIFTPLFVSIVEVGETTGTLDTAFHRLYEYLSLDEEVKKRVASAVRYPIIVLAAIAMALGVISVFVIPNFAPLFRALGDNIPMPTRIIMGVSDFTVNYWPYLLVGMVFAFLATRSYLRTAPGRATWDRRRLKLPVIGAIMLEAALARVTRSLSVAIGAGLPMNQALATIAESTGNVFLAARVSGMCGAVESGRSLTWAASEAELFPPLVLQMISVGEETGAIPELMDETADFYQREVDYRLENLSAALEPILIVGVGICVLILALGVFLPMWDMVGQAKGL
ncbi:MAG: type II secretion system F family protein [Gammaproteobacteria bacterium]|nr:type II secretion system F family protein [Gammaproteobacteria bacterium]MDH3766897.1 type II secretion system F family protein [Gammaproteobacteria bacterium]